MSTLEKNLWKWLKEGKPTDCHATRVENLVALGTPDVDFCVVGSAGWLELKVAYGEGLHKTLRHYTTQQVEWHRKRAKAGGRSWFLVQYGRGRFLVPGSSAAALFEIRMQVTPTALVTLGGIRVERADQAWEIMADRLRRTH